MLTKEEGGGIRRSSGIDLQFCFRTTDVTGWCRVGPGGGIDAGRQCMNSRGIGPPIAMEQGVRFAVREGGRTVGAGVVTEIVA
ncbi:MAG: hypothetical protein R3B74_12450 [Nitrospirales bacterium]|nr:hypothetical protein [Nitrospirales bacterium]